ncbi:MAG: MFS transporter [Clostridiales bacterium]|nr:MFS transporter [Clostridiales bacterium]
MEAGKRELTGRYSLIQGFYWMNYSVLSGFVSVYMLDHGLNNAQIGAMIAVAGAAAALLQPVTAAYADRRDAPPLTRILGALLAVFLVFAAALNLLYHRSALMVVPVYCACLMLLQVMTPLVHSVGMETLNRGDALRFSFARGMGSLLYAVVTYLMGWLLPRTGTRLIPAAMFALYAALLALVCTYPLRPRPQDYASSARKGDGARFLARYPSYRWVLVGVAGLFLSHGIFNSFCYQIVLSKGGGEQEMGTALALACVFELPVMFGFDRLKRYFSPRTMMGVTGIFFFLKAVGTYISPNIPLFYVTQVFQICAWGLIAVCSVEYVNQEMRPEDVVKGQAWFTTMNTLGVILGSLLGGVLLDNFGVPGMIALSIAASAAGAVVLILALRKG